MRSVKINCSCQGANLDKFIQAQILLLLNKKPMYGLEIINALSDRPLFSGARPDPTGTYRYLKKMEEDGHLHSQSVSHAKGERPLKTYYITDEGRNCLANWAVALGQYSVDIISLVREIEDALEEDRR